jgi:hypothetical protein
VGEAMNVYYDFGFQSRGIERVVTELNRYLPTDVEVASFPAEADLVVLHVVGKHDHLAREAKHILEHGRHYAIIQYVLQSTRNPNPADWVSIWNGADLVWSYYDIGKYCPRFYHAPLAAAPSVFYKQDANKEFLVGTNGYDYRTECYGEVRLAAWNTEGRTIHIGKKFDDDPNVDYHENVTDDELRGFYNSTQWWSSLRRKEGFEIGTVEALLCGTRPIMFDTPNYRQWFDGLVDFVPECNPGELSGKLKRVFLGGPRPVTDGEIEDVKKRFNWKEIIDGFWNRLLHQ